MKYFIIDAFIFISIPLIVVFFLEVWLAQNSDSLFYEERIERIFMKDFEKFKWINDVHGDSLIVLSGSSSVRYGLSCNVLNKLSEDNFKHINIALDAGDPIQTYFYLKNFNTDRFHTVYFGLDPMIYTKKYYLFRPDYMYLDFTFIELIRFSMAIEKKAVLKRYGGLVAYYFISCESYEYNDCDSIPLDYGSKILDRLPNNFNESISEYFNNEGHVWSDLQFEYLKKISALCEERQINFVVFIPPKRSDFTIDYKENLIDIHNTYLRKIQDQGFQVEIFGKLDMLDNLGDSTLFVEAHHLNKTGQLVYSEVFHKMTKENMGLFSVNYSWFDKE